MALTDKINDGFRQLATLVKGKVDKTAVIDLAHGGTGATTLATAQTNLGIDKVVSANTRLTTAKYTFPNVFVDSNGQLQKTQFATWLDHAKMYNGLFPNGSFQMGDATGWKLETSGLLTRDTTDFPFGAQACLRCAGQTSGDTRLTLDSLPVNPYMKYRLSAMFKYEKYSTLTSFFAGINNYDIDGYQILYSHAYHVSNTLTTLAQDLKVGDTKVYLTSLSGWIYSSNNAFKFYNYQDSRGFLYNPSIMPYSRYVYKTWWDTANAASFDAANNAIVLNKAWTISNPKDAQGIWRAGTQIAQGYSSSATSAWVLKNAWQSGVVGITQWDFTQVELSGIAMTETDDNTKFRAGTASIAPIFAFNLGATANSANDITKVSNLYFEKI